MKNNNIKTIYNINPYIISFCLFVRKTCMILQHTQDSIRHKIKGMTLNLLEVLDILISYSTSQKRYPAFKNTSSGGGESWWSKDKKISGTWFPKSKLGMNHLLVYQSCCVIGIFILKRENILKLERSGATVKNSEEKQQTSVNSLNIFIFLYGETHEKSLT